MNRREYAIHVNQIRGMLVKYQFDNDLEDEWFLRMLLELSQANVVRFDDKEAL